MKTVSRTTFFILLAGFGLSVPFPGAAEEPLGPEDLVQAVLAANPQIRGQQHAVTAAEDRSEVAGTSENPMLMYAVSPLMLANNFQGAHQAEISQTIPWAGKTGLEKSMAENDAAMQKIILHGTAHDLATQARLQFAERSDLWLNEHAFHEEMDRLDELHKMTLAAIASGKANQADAIMVEMELHMIHEGEISNHAKIHQVEAEINRLANGNLASRLGTKIPTFPWAVTGGVTDAPDVRMAALTAKNADLQRRLTEKNNHPDISVFAGVNTMWMDKTQWPMVGVRLALPVHRASLRAGNEAAEQDALAAKEKAVAARSDRQAMADKAEAMLDEARRLKELYTDTAAPLAARRLESIKAAYGNGKAEIKEVVDALRAKIQTDLMIQRTGIMEYKALTELALANGKALIDQKEGSK